MIIRFNIKKEHSSEWKYIFIYALCCCILFCQDCNVTVKISLFSIRHFTCSDAKYKLSNLMIVSFFIFFLKKRLIKTLPVVCCCKDILGTNNYLSRLSFLFLFLSFFFSFCFEYSMFYHYRLSCFQDDINTIKHTSMKLVYFIV